MKNRLNSETSYRLKILQQREIEYIEQQPNLKKLREKLLEHGGDTVCLSFDEDCEKIISRGELFKGRGSKMMKGRPSQCHSNSAELWDLNKTKVSLVTGYALSMDEDGLGVWRCHSWLVSKESGKVIETTEKRKSYFGFQMTEEESEQFYWDNH